MPQGPVTCNIGPSKVGLNTCCSGTYSAKVRVMVGRDNQSRAVVRSTVVQSSTSQGRQLVVTVGSLRQHRRHAKGSATLRSPFSASFRTFIAQQPKTSPSSAVACVLSSQATLITPLQPLNSVSTVILNSGPRLMPDRPSTTRSPDSLPQ